MIGARRGNVEGSFGGGTGTVSGLAILSFLSPGVRHCHEGGGSSVGCYCGLVICSELSESRDTEVPNNRSCGMRSLPLGKKQVRCSAIGIRK